MEAADITAVVVAEAADLLIPADLFQIQEDLDITTGAAGRDIFIAMEYRRK